ncbi:MAG: MBG domain-containing protein [Caldilineaceae bacterium]
MTNSPVTYNGAQQAAAVTGSVAGTVSAVKYDGSATEPTNAATYAVTADFAPTDSANYNSLSAASAGNFTINKATPTLSVTNSPVTYSGSLQAASVAGSVPGAVSAVLYDGSATEPTAAGTYAVAADFIPTDGANYNSLSAAAAGNFTINKATPLLSVTNSPVTYNGSSQAASVTGSVAGAVSAVLYDGSATEPTNAGTYAVTADFTPTDGVNYNSLSAAAAGNFVIDKAATTTTVSCGAGPFTYSGSAIEPCSASVAGPSLSLTLTVTYTNNVNAGTATADASYAGDANHLPSSDSKNFTIDKATPTLSITNPAVVYTGSPQAANVIGSVAGAVSAVKYDGSSTAPTDIGVYAVTADFAPTDSANYNSLSGATAGNFEITAAPTIPTLSVNNSPVVYNGSPQAAIVTGSTPGTVSAIKYNGSPTVPTNAGTYAVTADFTPDDTVNYTSLSGASAGNFVIQKATPLLSITNPAVVFTGSPQTANVVGSVAGAVSAVKYDGSTTAPTNVGVYAVTANFVPTDSTNYNSLSGAAAGNFSITATPTTPTLSVTNSPVIYNGSPQAATVVGSTPGTVSAVKYNGSSTVPTNAGAYAITADFTPNDTVNYTGLSGASAGNFIINKAATTTTVTCSGGPFPGTGTAIQPCTATVTGPGLNQPLPVTYLNNVNAGTATASASYPGSANYLPSSDSKTFVIGKATPTLTVTNSPVTYSGAAQAASVSGSVPGTVSAIKYNGSATVPTNAGTYAITADFTPDDAANYSSLSGAAAGSFVINKAATTTTVTCSAGPFVDGNVAIQPCAAQVTGPALNQALPVTYTNNVHAGTATASASYAGDANYLPSSDTKSFTIISGASETIQVYLPFAMR